MMPFVHDDGGRIAAGYKGTTGDCAPRAHEALLAAAVPQ
jgi:hypothetical protein